MCPDAEVHSLRRIKWAVEDPNVLTVNYKSGTQLRLLTTRRSQDNQADNQTTTSEYYEETFEKAGSSTSDYDQFQPPSTEVSQRGAIADLSPATRGLRATCAWRREERRDIRWGADRPDVQRALGASRQVRGVQKFTKYKFRSEKVAARAGGPVIVGTQVLILTPISPCVLATPCDQPC